MSKTCWATMINNEMDRHGETWNDVVASAPPVNLMDWDRLFDDGYGCEEGEPFTLWTKSRVYFPACYDGAEWVASVPRDPNDEVTEHVGGG